MCYKIKKKAFNILRGSMDTHYVKLDCYKVELQKFNKKEKFELLTNLTNGGRIFKRFYTGFFNRKKGNIDECRSYICLDKCFLKTGMGGVLLSIVARDENNQMFSISGCVRMKIVGDGSQRDCLKI